MSANPVNRLNDIEESIIETFESDKASYQVLAHFREDSTFNVSINSKAVLKEENVMYKIMNKRLFLEGGNGSYNDTLSIQSLSEDSLILQSNKGILYKLHRVK
jgi:hypothetical protein